MPWPAWGATVSARLGAALGLQVGGGIEDVNHELVGGIYTQMARHIFCLKTTAARRLE